MNRLEDFSAILFCVLQSRYSSPTAHTLRGLLPPECLMLAKNPLVPPAYLSISGEPHRLNDASISHNQKL